MAGRFLNALTSTSNREIVFGNGNHDIPQIKICEDQSRRTRKNMKKIFVIIFVLCILPILVASSVKVIYIPDNIKIEENASKEILVRNMSEVEIYTPYSIYIIDDFIYLLNHDSSEVIKLSLKGEIIGRVGKKGQGPHEFMGLLAWAVLKKISQL